MGFWELVLTTALSAFFASLAAVAVSIRLATVERRRSAHRDVYRALRAHLELLWKYSIARTESVRQGLQSPLTTNSAFYAEKPGLGLLAVELFGIAGSLSRGSRLVLTDEVEALLSPGKSTSVAEDEEAINQMIERLLAARW